MAKIEIIGHKNCKFMWIDDSLWMWDTPQERDLQKELAEMAYGDVLIAGYGFGILTEYVTNNAKVKSTTTVEKYEEVINKNKESGKIFGNIILEDFFDIPEDKKYDCIIGDIWPDIDKKFLQDYLGFKIKSERLLKENGTMLAWGKDYFEYLLEKNKLADICSD